MEDPEKSRRNIQGDTIKLRKASPDREEGLQFAKFFNEASEGFFRSMLGIKTFEILADAYLKPNNEYSYENVTMIEYNSQIVGMVSGYTYAEKEGFNRNILFQFPKGAKLRILIFSVIGRILSRFLGPQRNDDYYLQAIAISSQMRRKGLGQRLIKHSEGIAHKKGSNTLSLDVSSKNEKAINCYKKYGMEIFSSWPNFLKLSPVFTHMVKEI
ncbi:MAG: GNAT family N-acetyltransferase [Maribacter sp.]|nr:GNAT family N-acetyltransferase [Maribacter sp.]